jgi:hypothetical protein
MPGASVNTGELKILQQSIDNKESPKEVLKVLSGAEYKAYRGNAPVEVIILLRQRIFDNVDLPEDFLDKTDLFNELSLNPSFLENSDQMAILCKHLESDKVEEIRKWMLQKLANHLKTTETNIQAQINFTESRTCFGGPVAVAIINDERDIADQL